MEELKSLQERITFLEKHVTEQDAEMYQQAKRIDALQLTIKKLELKLSALEDGGGDMPADEKPPHY